MATFINPAGYLKIILGPMTSGKTTELIKEYNTVFLVLGKEKAVHS